MWVQINCEPPSEKHTPTNFGSYAALKNKLLWKTNESSPVFFLLLSGFTLIPLDATALHYFIQKIILTFPPYIVPNQLISSLL